MQATIRLIMALQKECKEEILVTIHTTADLTLNVCLDMNFLKDNPRLLYVSMTAIGVLKNLSAEVI